jgi:glycosyltransferase involved in cell wall biosynthesis/tetratricopeptide (TPR) repeat protein
MAAQEEQFAAEPDAAAKHFVRKFDSDSGAAIAQFRQMLPQKAQAGKLLQQLNKLDRQDVALAVTDAVPFDAKTGDLVIVERARALVQTGSTPAAEQLLDAMRATRSGEYAFNYNAGRVMADARIYPQALAYYEAAFRAKPTAQAAERVFLTLMGLERYDDAAAAIGRIIRIGSYREELAEDFAFLLRRVPPGKLDPELAFALASLPEKDEEEVAPALLPHLIASDLLDSVLAAVDRGVTGFVSWDDEALLNLIPYLERRGQTEHLLRVYEQSGDISPAVREQFERLFAALPVERIAAFSMPDVGGHLSGAGVAQDYRNAESIFSRSMSADSALAMIRLLPQLVPAAEAQAFYAREKRKLGRLAALVAEKLADNDEAIARVADFVVHWARPAYGKFFSGPDMADLVGAIANAQRMNAAPVNSKPGQLREEFFRFHLDRRFIRLESLTNDFELCNIAQNYFRFSSDQRPAVGTPVGQDLAVRVGKPSMSLGGNKPLDVLTSYALMQDRPKFSLSQSPDYDEFCWWYMTKIAGTRRAPPGCLRPEIVAYLNEILSASDFSGVPITRFLRMVWMKSGEFRKTFDLGNFIDRILFVLDRIQNFLLRSSEHLPFFGGFLENRDSVFGQVVQALSDGSSNLVGATQGVSPQYAAVTRDAPQDILVIGHASKDSGLGRNYHMLKAGLSASGANVTGIDFDAHAATANDQLVRWRENCRTAPIAVFAVNANDAPDFFLKDRRGILMDTYNCGFFLWEVSTPPTVQKLGIALVDEIWAPTRYVANIYAPLKTTHVVGKGLFNGDEPFLHAPRPASSHSPFRFVTVFDFDSSIERKNPLAVVMAFQDAFRGNENVELIVKTSNVNPQHWSNAWKQWEHLLGASAGDARVRIVNERYTGEQMVALVRDADCVVSLHRSEGFGYLMSDAMAFGTPVIATNYSGNADFAGPENAYPVDHKLIQVPDGAARWICEGAVWADADIADAARQIRSVYDDYAAACVKAARARANIKERYSTATFAATLSQRIGAIRNRTR